MTPGARIRVGIFAPSLDILGGQSIEATQLYQRLRGIAGLHVEYVVINPRAPGPLHWLQRIKYVRTLVTSLCYCASLLRRVPRLDVLHIFSPAYWAFLLGPVPAMVMGRLFGKRVILNYHSGEARDHLSRFGWYALPMLGLAHRIVVPSQYLVNEFADFGLEATPISNVVDEAAIPWRARNQLRPVLLSNRNFEAHYNVGAVLDAFALIAARAPGATLTVAGDGSQRTELRAHAEQLGVEGVTFAGPVPPGDMPDFYDAADVFVNASLVDNMPLSILEAYVAGLPVVSSDSGGIPHIARHEETALLVPGGDARGIADAVLRLLRDPALARRLATNARELAMSTYTWDVVGPAWVSLYRDITSRSS